MGCDNKNIKDRFLRYSKYFRQIMKCKMNWNWNLTQDGTLQIFNGKALYWEVDCCYNYTAEQQKTVAEEFISNYQEWIKE